MIPDGVRPNGNPWTVCGTSMGLESTQWQIRLCFNTRWIANDYVRFFKRRVFRFDLSETIVSCIFYVPRMDRRLIQRMLWKLRATYLHLHLTLSPRANLQTLIRII